jgi:hypothetical protein
MTPKSHDTHDFEKLYLRWKYFLKGRLKVTDEVSAAKYLIAFKREILSSSNTFYFKNKVILERMGMSLDDVISISQVHLISYIGAFSLENNLGKLEIFKEKHQKKHEVLPTKEDILKKDRINFMSFLRQRYTELIKYCLRELQKISMDKIERKYFKSKHVVLNIANPDILRNYKKYGYVPVKMTEFQKLRKSLKHKNDFVHEGWHYFAVSSEMRSFIEDNLLECMHCDNIVGEDNLSPEDILIRLEENKEQENLLQDATLVNFYEMPKDEQKKYIRTKRRLHRV